MKKYIILFIVLVLIYFILDNTLYRIVDDKIFKLVISMIVTGIVIGLFGKFLLKK